MLKGIQEIGYLSTRQWLVIISDFPFIRKVEIPTYPDMASYHTLLFYRGSKTPKYTLQPIGNDFFM